MIKPLYQWRNTFQAIQSDDKQYYEHNGKTFEVLEDITDDAFKGKEGLEEYGYVRRYKIKLEDGTIIEALENEVEDFPIDTMEDLTLKVYRLKPQHEIFECIDENNLTVFPISNINEWSELQLGDVVKTEAYTFNDSDWYVKVRSKVSEG